MTELSALDLHYLVQELKFLEGAKVDKITQPEKEEVVIQLYVTNKGKQALKITPKLIYRASKKQETAEKLYGFCSALRKYLSSSRLESINQVNSERIAELVFKTKEEKYYLIAELFAKGNIILCNNELKVIVPLRTSKTKDREVKAGVKYVYPKREIDFFKITLPKLKSVIKKSGKTVSKTIAVDVGLGGKHAKELCLSAKVDENSKTPDEKEIKSIFDALKKLINKKREAKLPLSSEIETEAESQTKKKSTKYQKELERLQKIIKKQESKIKEIITSSDENQKKGELMYEKYQLVNEVLEEIRKARKKYSWKDIKDRLKGHPLVKEVNEKKGEIIIELG
jgi:predicted ribosome quality control (RQC) complex YloA/Tae2 family protein